MGNFMLFFTIAEVGNYLENKWVFLSMVLECTEMMVTFSNFCEN